MKEVPQNYEFLPEDLIISIFLKLPVKSLCRFQCMSKPWFTLITASYFTKIYISCQEPKLIVSCNKQHSSKLYSTNLEQPDNFQAITAPPLKSPGREITVTLNGLILIPSSMSFCLWNPSTRHYKVIPYPNTSNRVPMLYGFGYDSSMDDYKVVYAESTSCVHVLNLRTNSWRRIQNLPIDISSSSDQCVLNGIIHWRADKGVIICFDLAEERFWELPIPENFEKTSICGLGISKGCVWIAYRDERLDVKGWTMKEYGVRESWTEFFSCFNLDPRCMIKGVWVESEEDKASFKLLHEKEGKYHLFISKEVRSESGLITFEQIAKYLLGNGVANFVESTVPIPDGVVIAED